MTDQQFKDFVDDLLKNHSGMPLSAFTKMIKQSIEWREQMTTQQKCDFLLMLTGYMGK